MMTMAEYEREIRRRLWRRRLRAAGEFAGAATAAALGAVLVWAYLALTPSQMSAGYDRAAAATRAFESREAAE